MVLVFTSNTAASPLPPPPGLAFSQTGGDNDYGRREQQDNHEPKKNIRPAGPHRTRHHHLLHQLTRDEIIQMVDLMIARVGNQLRTKDMAMELSDKAKALLAKRGFDPVLGARPLRRTIQREIEDQLSEKILFDEVGPGQIVTVDVENWDGEGPGEDAVFTFVGTSKPPADTDLAKAGAGGPGTSG